MTPPRESQDAGSRRGASSRSAGRRWPAASSPVDGGVTSRDELLTIHVEATAYFRQQLADSWVPDYLSGRSLDAA